MGWNYFNLWDVVFFSPTGNCEFPMSQRPRGTCLAQGYVKSAGNTQWQRCRGAEREQAPTHRCAASGEGSHCPAQMPHLIFVFGLPYAGQPASHPAGQKNTGEESVPSGRKDGAAPHFFFFLLSAMTKNTTPSRPASCKQIPLPYPLNFPPLLSSSLEKKFSELDGFRRWLGRTASI